ncbi:MAG: GxxExxY protein, partial [Phototrophicales bacterium]
PGLLESAYEECFAYELRVRDLAFERQKAISVIYKTLRLESGFRVDFLVENRVVVELKAVDQVVPVHKAQLKTYLTLTQCKLGLLLNFNVSQMIKGVHRVVLGLVEKDANDDG